MPVMTQHPRRFPSNRPFRFQTPRATSPPRAAPRRELALALAAERLFLGRLLEYRPGFHRPPAG
jgi:hypothetical protein